MCSLLYVDWVLFWNGSVLIPNCLIYYIEASADDNTGDVNTGVSNGMCILLYSQSGIILEWIHSDTNLLSDVLNYADNVDQNSGVDEHMDIEGVADGNTGGTLQCLDSVLYCIHSFLIPMLSVFRYHVVFILFSYLPLCLVQ
jgi:hypothetical protein